MAPSDRAGFPTFSIELPRTRLRIRIRTNIGNSVLPKDVSNHKRAAVLPAFTFIPEDDWMTRTMTSTRATELFCD